MDNASHQERQDDEFQALQAIFEKDVEDLRVNVWEVSSPLKIKLSLRPQQSMGGNEQESYAMLDMIVQCPARYPDVIPKIDLVNIKGLSDQLVAKLKEDLTKEASENVGEVMIWQLANKVQIFLHKHNRPPQQSFYDQMLLKQQQQIEEQKMLEEQKRHDTEQDKRRQHEEFQSELRKRKENPKSRHDSERESQPKYETDKGPVVQQPSELLKAEEHHKAAEWSTPVVTTGMNMPKQFAFSPSASPIVPCADRNHGAAVRSVSPVTPVKVGSPPKGSSAPASRRQRRTSTPKREEDDYDVCTCKDRSRTVCSMNFSSSKGERCIHKGQCLGHGDNGSTVYVGMDSVTGELVAVSEWVMQWRHCKKRANSLNKEDDTDAAAHLKQVKTIEQEFTSLMRLKHPNLIHYLAFQYQYDPGRVTVHVLMEYSGGTSLAVYTHHKDPLPLEMLRVYTIELVEVLKYLHANSIVHKNLRASSVFVDQTGKVRLGDYSINKRLGDMYQAVDKERPGVHFTQTEPMIVGGRGGQKADIYQLGLLLLSLVLGEPPSGSLPDVPVNLPPSLRDLLSQCLSLDERTRWTTGQLLSHPFLKDPIIHSPLPVEQTQAKEISQHSGSKESDENGDSKEEDFVYLSSLVASGQSRLTSEFELLKLLGKGGFGDVLKVKNKLDGRFYAIKRIPLNPKSKHFNRKMKREVNLLSRLSHENVVRYYCSWIEVSDDPAQSDTSSNITSSSRVPEAPLSAKKAPHIVKCIPLTKTQMLPTGVPSANNSSFDSVRNLENFLPANQGEDSEWLPSFDHGSEPCYDSSSDEEEDEADVFGNSFMPKVDMSEDSIVFDSPDNIDIQFELSETQPSTSTDQKTDGEPEELVVKLLYIQMEYCEKSTLRICIDNGLCKNLDLMWQLFREIIEGLVYIHSQGMIHRDLKPVNIFLDSNHHVKIGDFGLATTEILAKAGGVGADTTLPTAQDLGLNQSGSGDGNLTGKVGTALYASPEIMQGGGKVRYDQKVDIYSLGIIFFEMCSKTLHTGMERVNTLNSLRSEAIILPDYFDKSSDQAELIKWLLNHDSDQRPTSKELLASTWLPPPPKQETLFGEMLNTAINETKSSSHRHLLSAIFGQAVSLLSDFHFDKKNYELALPFEKILVHQKIKETLIRIFSTHGATPFGTPLLLPKLAIYEDNKQQVQVMNQNGGIACLPLDLRVSFARYIGCNSNSIQQHTWKRYAIEKVFHEKFFNVHPRELIECAFDIVSLSACHYADAEVLSLVQEIIDEFPSLQANKAYVRMNHMNLLKSLFLHCGIPESAHDKAIHLLAENMENKSKRISVLESVLQVKIPESKATMMNNLLDTECDRTKVSSSLKCLSKGSSQAAQLAKSSIQELEKVVTHAQHLGLRLQVLVSLGFIYQPSQYSGLVFQVMCHNKWKKRVVPKILAVGGRYDKLIERFMIPRFGPSHNPVPQAVGISFAFDILVSIASEDKQMQKLSPCDILLCNAGDQSLMRECQSLSKDLWKAGIRASIYFDPIHDWEVLQTYCRTFNISQYVVLKVFRDMKDGDTTMAQVYNFDKTRWLDKMVKYKDLLEVLQAKETNDLLNTQRLTNKEMLSHGDNGHTSQPDKDIAFKFNFNFKNSSASVPVKRKHESVISGKVPTMFPWLPVNSVKDINVLAVDLPEDSIKVLQGSIELKDEQDFNHSKKLIFEKLSKHRKILDGVMDSIHLLKFKEKIPYFIMYSTVDYNLRLIT